MAGALAGFDDAWSVIDRQRRLDAAGAAALEKSLADDDRRMRDFAIVRLGEQKQKSAVPALCNLLKTEKRPELVLRAIGALVSIGDARAVEPLIELSNQKDPDFVLQVVFAVGAIGGRTAEAYLVTMASGHPIETVRQGAEQALAEMKRQK
jgi:HEAT repeat protein